MTRAILLGATFRMVFKESFNEVAQYDVPNCTYYNVFPKNVEFVRCYENGTQEIPEIVGFYKLISIERIK